MSYRSLAFAIILLLGLVMLSCDDDKTIEGRVDHKAITGEKNETSYTILVNNPQAEGDPLIHVKDSAYSGDIPATGSAIINQELAEKILLDYSNVTYLVNIDDDPEKVGTTSYLVDRELFNLIDVGSSIKFKSGKHGDFKEIKELLD